MADESDLGREELAELNRLEREARAGEYIPGCDGGGAVPEGGPPPGPGIAEPTTGEIVASILKITCGIIAAKTGRKHWELTDPEAQVAGEAYGAVIDKYFPDLSMGVELTAVVVTLTIFGPRFQADAEVRAQPEQQEGEGEKARPEPSE